MHKIPPVKKAPHEPMEPVPLPHPQPIASSTTGLKLKKKFYQNKIVMWSGIGVLVLFVALIVGGWLWYQALLRPVGDNPNEYVKVVVELNSTPSEISNLLVDKKVIRSANAFSLYTRLSGTQNNLQAGTYRLSPADTTPQIVEHLSKGNVDSFDITFLPGSTLADNRTVLIDAGYSTDEVDTALSAQYDSPLFATKPAGTDLEGYIYGDTYRFGAGASVKDILEYTFSTYEAVIEKNDLVAKFQAQGLSLYEGITLASIIQREAIGGDEAQIAQVFYSRIAIGMELGSDVTYQYIADKTGVARDPNLDSPYNTRRYAGLPPGPISAPGLQALIAVGSPAAGDYLYFLSGDDDITYYSRTYEGHEQNIADHCKIKCAIF